MMLHFEIPQTWDMVRKIRADVQTLLHAQPPTMATAAVMVASELAENAIKYGTSVDATPNASLDVNVTDEMIVITATNGVTNTSHAALVLNTVEKIKSAEDSERLYIGRLMQIAEQNEPDRSQFGLLRIAHEGQFQIECKYENNVLRITASRKIDHATP